MSTRRRTLGALAASLVLAGLSAGCSSKDRSADSPESDLEPWSGQLQELYNDQIHPGAVGLSMDAQAPARDPLLRLRTTNADVASRMRVSTVDHYVVGAKTTFALQLQVVPPPFFKPKLEDDTFELTIKQDSPVFGMVQSLGEKLRGMTFIGFMRKFPSDDGPVIHWHLTSAADEVAEVVREAAILDEIGGSEK